MSQHLHRTLLAAVCATAAVGLAACNPANPTSAAPATSASSAAAGAPSSTASTSSTSSGDQADPNAGLPTGSKLASLLLPAGSVPKSLKPDPSGTRNTADVFAAPSSAAAPTAKACSSLNATAWVNSSGIGAGSFAQSDFTDSYSDMFAQEIDAYPGSDAHAVISRLKHLFTECASFTYNQSGTDYTEKLATRALPGLGDEAVQAVITSKSFTGGTTLVAVRVGNRVVTTLYNDQASTGAAGVALTRNIVQGVVAAH